MENKCVPLLPLLIEVMLLNLCQAGEYTDDLFAISQPAEATRVMAVLDQINQRWGRGTLRSSSVPIDPDWGIRRDMMSKSYTTKIDQLWAVICKYVDDRGVSIAQSLLIV